MAAFERFPAGVYDNGRETPLTKYTRVQHGVWAKGWDMYNQMVLWVLALDP
jgi:hypothetical protein